jgi:REP element-mobilizing transposase RayT
MFITTNVQAKKEIFLKSEYAREAVEAIYRTQERLPFFLYSFVIMPDHCHLLLQVPEGGSISKIIAMYKRAVVFHINQGALWQSRFHLKIPDSLDTIIQYIHMNPVKQGLCQKPEEYPWSSASGKWDITLRSCFE